MHNMYYRAIENWNCNFNPGRVVNSWCGIVDGNNPDFSLREIKNMIFQLDGCLRTYQGRLNII